MNREEKINQPPEATDLPDYGDFRAIIEDPSYRATTGVPQESRLDTTGDERSLARKTPFSAQSRGEAIAKVAAREAEAASRVEIYGEIPDEDLAKQDVLTWYMSGVDRAVQRSRALTRDELKIVGGVRDPEMARLNWVDQQLDLLDARLVKVRLDQAQASVRKTILESVSPLVRGQEVQIPQSRLKLKVIVENGQRGHLIATFASKEGAAREGFFSVEAADRAGQDQWSFLRIDDQTILRKVALVEKTAVVVGGSAHLAGRSPQTVGERLLQRRVEDVTHEFGISSGRRLDFAKKWQDKVDVQGKMKKEVQEAVRRYVRLCMDSWERAGDFEYKKDERGWGTLLSLTGIERAGAIGDEEYCPLKTECRAREGLSELRRAFEAKMTEGLKELVSNLPVARPIEVLGHVLRIPGVGKIIQLREIANAEAQNAHNRLRLRSLADYLARPNLAGQSEELQQLGSLLRQSAQVEVDGGKFLGWNVKGLRQKIFEYEGGFVDDDGRYYLSDDLKDGIEGQIKLKMDGRFVPVTWQIGRGYVTAGGRDIYPEDSMAVDQDFGFQSRGETGKLTRVTGRRVLYQAEQARINQWLETNLSSGSEERKRAEFLADEIRAVTGLSIRDNLAYFGGRMKEAGLDAYNIVLDDQGNPADNTSQRMLFIVLHSDVYLKAALSKQSWIFDEVLDVGPWSNLGFGHMWEMPYPDAEIFAKVNSSRVLDILRGKGISVDTTCDSAYFNLKAGRIKPAAIDLCLVDLADLTGYERDDSQGIMREWLRNANDACDARGDLVRLLSRGKLGPNHWGEPMPLADLIGKFKYVAGGVAEQRAREAFFCELGRGALLKLMREIRYPDYEKLIPGMVTYAAEGGAFMASYRDLFFAPLGIDRDWQALKTVPAEPSTVAAWVVLENLCREGFDLSGFKMPDDNFSGAETRKVKGEEGLEFYYSDFFGTFLEAEMQAFLNNHPDLAAKAPGYLGGNGRQQLHSDFITFAGLGYSPENRSVFLEGNEGSRGEAVAKQFSEANKTDYYQVLGQFVQERFNIGSFTDLDDIQNRAIIAWLTRNKTNRPWNLDFFRGFMEAKKQLRFAFGPHAGRVVLRNDPNRNFCFGSGLDYLNPRVSPETNRDRVIFPSNGLDLVPGLTPLYHLALKTIRAYDYFNLAFSRIPLFDSNLIHPSTSPYTYGDRFEFAHEFTTTLGVTGAARRLFLARAGVNPVFHFAYDNFQKYIIGQVDIKTGKPRADDLVEKAGIQGALRTFGKIGEAAGSLLPFVPRNGLDAAITAGLYFSPVVNGFVATAIGTASAGITLPSAVFIAGNLIFAGVLTRAVPIFGGISPTIRKILGRIPGLHDYPGDAREDVKAILARISAKVGK